VVSVYADNDVSAFTGKARPEYARLLRDVQAGKVDAVVAWHTDRLHRNVREQLDYIDLSRRLDLPTQTVSSGTLDLSTANGRAAAITLGAWARAESEHKSERIQRAHQQSAEKGKWRGGARPFGYLEDTRTLHPGEAPAIQRAYRQLLAGASFNSIVRDWNDRGLTSVSGKRWSYQTVRQVMLRPRNYGASIYRGEVVGTGDWQPLVDEASWRGVHAILTDPARKGGSNRARWLLSGVARCGVCGETVKIGSGSGRNGRKWAIYVCKSGSHLGRRADYCDTLVSAVVVERLSQPDAQGLLVADQPDRDDCVLEARALRSQIEEAVSLYSEGVLSAAELRTTKARLTERLAEVEERLIDKRRNDVLGDVVGDDAEARWLALSVDRQRAVVRELLDVTLLRVPPERQRRFHADTVQMDWRG
jgi:site-specific DNA recombinase